ncbi:MAG: hypothetical protein LBT65_07455 [Synergistaceae bacterium]|nr:hypothetical protein [Synergistaceae bacterium]
MTDENGRESVQVAPGEESDVVQLESLRLQIETLQKSETKLIRQLRRLQDTAERDKTLALAKINLNAMRTAEQQKQEKYMKLLLESSPDVILLLDSGGRFSYCTNSFLKKAHIADFGLINGRSFNEVFGRFADEAWGERVFDMLTRSMRENTTLSFEENVDIGKDDNLRKY